MKVSRNQKGVALLTVLLATALMAVLAVGMTTEQQIGIRRTENLLEGDQAMLLARGIEEWGAQVLMRDLQGTGQRDHLGEDWAMGLLPTPVGNGMVSGRLEDVQGRINLNNLLDNDPHVRVAAIERLDRLCMLCDMDTSMVDALQDWLDPDINKRVPDGAEDDDYLLKDIPYRTGNRKMTSITELALVQGVTPEHFQCLRPNIAALPDTTDINVNTAGAMVVASIGGGLSLADAKEVVKARPEDGYPDMAAFLDDPRMVNSRVNTNGLDEESKYFMLNGQAIFGRSEVLLYSSLERVGSSVRVFSHSIGAY